MTTLQAVFGQLARRTDETGDRSLLWTKVRYGLGIALLVATLAAALAIRVLVYVHL
jgi:methylaspartate ammonia-lyase